MPSKIQLTSIVLATAGIWGLLLLLQGVGINWSWLSPLSTVTGVLALILAAFDRWLWRIPLLHGWLVYHPDIGGTWKAAFLTTYVDPTTGMNPGPAEAYMSIRQTYSDIRLRLMTTESTSTVISASTAYLPDGTYRVTAVYLNEPTVIVRHLSPIHYGSLILTVPKRNPQHIRGIYWTDRGTAGELLLDMRNRTVVYEFNEARALLSPRVQTAAR